MPNLSTLLSLLTASTAILAHPLIPRADNAGSFSIASFTDSGSPHSVEAYIRFTVSDASASTPIANVYCSATEAIQPTIATTPFPTACNDSSVMFGLQAAENGYYLTVAHYYDSNTTTDSGTVFLGADVETFLNPANPNGNYQYLNHAQDFTIGYNRV